MLRTHKVSTDTLGERKAFAYQLCRQSCALR